MLGDGPPDGSEFFKSLQSCNEHKQQSRMAESFLPWFRNLQTASEESMMQWRCVDDARKGTESIAVVDFLLRVAGLMDV